MENDEILTATEASRAFSEMLHRVCYGGESFLIKKGSRIMARIVPYVPQEKNAVEETAAQDEPRAAPDLQAEMTQAAPMTSGESEFYEAWMEQVRKTGAMSK